MINTNPLLSLANVPEKHVYVYVFAPGTREAKTPYCHVTVSLSLCTDEAYLGGGG